jgi:hypothetical protein
MSIVELPPREPVSGWVWLFLAATAATAAQLLLVRADIPFAGTAATAALLGLAVSRRPAAITAWAGLAALTLAAGLVDSGRGGYGWPLSIGPGAGPEVTVLLVAGVALLAAAVLRRVARGLNRRRLWPAAVVGALVVLRLVVYVIDPEVGWRETRPSPLALIAVLAVPVVAVILVVVAVNAAFTAGRQARPAAVGLLAVLALANTATVAAAGLDVLHRRPPAPDRASIAFLELGARIDPGQVSSAWVLTDQSPRGVTAISVDTSAVAIAGPAEAADICWCLNPWEGEFDWLSLLPAVLASLLLLGLAALTEFLFPRGGWGEQSKRGAWG